MISSDKNLGALDGGWKEESLTTFLASAREELRQREPETLAALCGIQFDASARLFLVSLFGQSFEVSYPDFTAHEVSSERHEATPWVHCLLFHYFRHASGARLAHRWISYRELPGGTFYHQAFQGYSGDRLARAIGNDLAALEMAAHKLGGKRESMGDLSFSFAALPRVPVALVYWLGDDEFPPSAKVLFDASASDYLPTDALAVVGGRLCGLLLEAAGKRD